VKYHVISQRDGTPVGVALLEEGRLVLWRPVASGTLHVSTLLARKACCEIGAKREVTGEMIFASGVGACDGCREAFRTLLDDRLGAKGAA
jgi:hypothetical protein